MKKIFESKHFKARLILLFIIMFYFSSTNINYSNRRTRVISIADNMENFEHANDLYSEGSIFSNGLDWNSSTNENLISNIVNDISPIHKTYSTIKNENFNSARPSFIDDLVRKNSDNKQGWKLMLHTSDWHLIDLEKLSFISYFTNIDTISFKVDNSIINKSLLGTPFNIKDLYKLSWLAKLPKLKKLEISYESPLQNVFKFNFSDFNFVEKLKSLEVLNISTLFSIDRNFQIGGSLYDSNWFIHAKRGINIWVPNDRDYVTNNNIEVISNSDRIYKLKKISTEPLGNPTFEDHSAIFVDGNKVESILIDGKWHWSLNDPSILKNILYADVAKRQYYTTIQKQNSNAFPIQKRNIDENMNSSTLESKLIRLPVESIKLSIDSIKTIDSLPPVNIDGQNYKYEALSNSKLYLKYNIGNIKYALYNKGVINYFSNILQLDNKKIRLISSVEKSNVNTIHKSTTVSIKSPMEYGDKINLINGHINTKIIKGKLYWNFINISNAMKYKYYSKNAHFLAENLKDFSTLNNIPSDINLLVFSDNSPSLLNRIKDGFEIKDTNDFKNIVKTFKNIIIDDKTYNITIRDGKWFYNAPLEKIRYVIEDSSGSKKYYTSLKYINEHGLDIKGVSELAESYNHYVPNIKNMDLPLYMIFNQFITIDGKKYSSTIRQGKIYWDVDRDFMKKIVYTDFYNNFYTFIPDNLPYKVSEVDLSNVPVKMPPLYEADELDSRKKLSVNSILKIINNNFYLDGKKIVPTFYKSSIYFKNNKNNIKLFDYRNKGSFYYYSESYEDKLSNSYIPNLWNIKDVVMRNYDEIQNDLPIILDPKNINDSIQIKLSNGSVEKINVVQKNHNGSKKLYWKFPNKIKMLKYVVDNKITGSKYYIKEANSKNLSDDDIEFSNIKKINVSSYDAKNIKEFHIIKTESKKSRNVIIIISTILGTIAISFAVYLSIKKMKGGK